MNAAALPTMLTIQLRTGYKALLAWVLALGATMVATTTSISSLYGTQAKIDSYAAAVGTGDALVALNGRVAGLHTLGGVVANEFGFLASFAIPLMGISLVAKMTRKEEESGRLEMLLAGRIGRTAPILAAVTIAAVALLLTAAALFAGLALVAVPAGDSLLYAASMAGLGFVFASVAAVVAQVVGHARGVYAAGLGTLIVSYLLRGIGDVLDNPLTWLSPLGWQEKTRAFGQDPRWWPLLVPVAVGLALAGVAFVVARHRDLGSALVQRTSGPTRASSFLRTPLGLVIRLHRGSVLGWAAGAVVVAAAFGSLTEPIIEAVAGNENLAQAMGAAGGSGVGAVLTMSVLLLALLCGAYVVHAVGMLRAEETSGRLEGELSGTRSRGSWLGVQALVVLAGLVVVAGAGGLTLALTAAWSTGDPVSSTSIEAVAAYLPAAFVLGALALLLFGLLPRLQPVAWLLYGVAALVAYLGDPLQLADPLLWLSPFQLVGAPPQDPAAAGTLFTLCVLAIVLVGAAFVGFRRRDIPRG
ncbi:MAG TPA: hypothetical protein VFG88_08335 [Nocardioidaceae bacterium]|nr:hypothetical protein [Nocardioidaceae bacterium]